MKTLIFFIYLYDVNNFVTPKKLRYFVQGRSSILCANMTSKQLPIVVTNKSKKKHSQVFTDT